MNKAGRLLCALLALLLIAGGALAEEEAQARYFAPGEALVLFEADGVRATLLGDQPAAEEEAGIFELGVELVNDSDRDVTVEFYGTFNGHQCGSESSPTPLGEVQAGSTAEAQIRVDATYMFVFNNFKRIEDLDAFTDLQTANLHFVARDGDAVLFEADSGELRFNADYIPGVSPYEPLSEGSRGDAVVALQQKLIELGHLDGKADGIYGKGTAAAVKAFQTAEGLEATGEADAATQEALFAK